MRPFENVDHKILEADFFLEKLKQVNWDFFAARFYFSAFVSASRSITFALQASLKGADDFDVWYTEQQSNLRQNKLAKFFHDTRTDSQHIGLNPMNGGRMLDGKVSFLFHSSENGIKNYVAIPSTDVVTCCEQNLKLICKIIDDCYDKFGLLIDPDQIYTQQGMEELGISIEEIELELGLPTGYSNLGSPLENNTKERLTFLKRQIPHSTVKPTLAKYRSIEVEEIVFYEQPN